VQTALVLATIVVATLVLRAEIRRTRKATMAALDDVIASLNDNTNAVSTRMDKLVAEIAATGQAPTKEQLASLQAISDHLKALGADPSNPVPAAPPEATTSPAPATPPP
jgi:hypothetical protein